MVPSPMCPPPRLESNDEGTIFAQVRTRTPGNEAGLPGNNRPTSPPSSGGTGGEAVVSDEAELVERRPLHSATASHHRNNSAADEAISSEESASLIPATDNVHEGTLPHGHVGRRDDNHKLSSTRASLVESGMLLSADKGLLKAAANAFMEGRHTGSSGRQTGRRTAIVAQEDLGLEQLISRALASLRVEDDGNRQAREITSKLKHLYITTTDQLKEALSDPDVLRSVHSDAIRGMLLLAVRKELQRVANQSYWKHTIAMAKAANRMHLNMPLLRRLHVARVDFTHISDIDQVSQTFHARLFLILRIVNGARDKNLTSDSEDFPFDKDGRPTFRPSAKWYLNQIDFPNGKNITVLDSKVTKEKNDLEIIQRIEGDFFERFELQNFPMDAQDLTITVSVNCATEGPVPVEFTLEPIPGAPPPQLAADTVNFAYSDIWDINPCLAAEVTDVGANAERRFPAVHLRACVARKPNFVLMNVAFPSAVISLLSLLTFFVSMEALGGRLNHSITLLLTVVAFKYTSAAYLPQISYWTLVDKYSALSSGIVVLVCILHSILGLLDNWVGESPDTLFMLNKVFFGVTATLWTAFQLWFISKTKIAILSETDSGQKRNLSNPERDPCEDPLTQDIKIELSKSGQSVAKVGGRSVTMDQSVHQAFRSSLEGLRRSTMDTIPSSLDLPSALNNGYHS